MGELLIQPLTDEMAQQAVDLVYEHKEASGGRDVVELTMTDPDIRAFVATEDDRLVAAGSVSIKPRQPDQAQMWNLVVDPKRRQCGIGSALLLHMETEMARLGARTLEVTGVESPGGRGFLGRREYRFAERSIILQHYPLHDIFTRTLPPSQAA